MSINYTTDKLCETTRLLENITSSDTVFSDRNLIDFMNIELRSSIIPLVKQCREDYLTVTKDFVFNANNPLYNSQIEIPSDSVGLSLRDVYCLDSNGNFYNVPRLDPTQAATFNATSFPYAGATSNNFYGGYAGFYLQGNYLQLFPASVAQANTFRLTFHRRPAQLVPIEDCGRIIQINSNMVTLNATPSFWNLTATLDAIGPNTTFEYVEDKGIEQKVYASYTPLINLVPTDINGQIIEFDQNIVDQLSVGDYIVEHSTAPFVQYLPIESYDLLCQAAANRALQSLNDQEAFRTGQQKFNKMASDMVNMISPRVENKPKVISSFGNGIGSHMRRGRYGY